MCGSLRCFSCIYMVSSIMDRSLLGERIGKMQYVKKMTIRQINLIIKKKYVYLHFHKIVDN